MPRFKKPVLAVRWSKGEKDLMFHYPDQRADGHYLSNVLGEKRSSTIFKDGRFQTQEEPSILEELKKRGYDITTLKFSIEKKKI